VLRSIGMTGDGLLRSLVASRLPSREFSLLPWNGGIKGNPGGNCEALDASPSLISTRLTEFLFVCHCCMPPLSFCLSFLPLSCFFSQPSFAGNSRNQLSYESHKKKGGCHEYLWARLAVCRGSNPAFSA